MFSSYVESRRKKHEGKRGTLWEQEREQQDGETREYNGG
jgi:hypothetical protein